MEECSHCGKDHYDDHPKHTVSGDCVRGFDADDNPIVLCWDCRPLYVLIRDGSGLNKFQLIGDE